MRNFVVSGYLMSAALYAMVWVNPSGRFQSDLLDWVSFTKLCLTEFLSVHAATLLGAVALGVIEDGADGSMGKIFWALSGFYAAMAAGAFLFHRSNRALIGFYLVLAVRGLQFFSLGTREADVMRAEVLKNFLMTVPMFILVAIVAMSDHGFESWQEAFQRPGLPVAKRLLRGRPLLAASAYYLLWAFVELEWPERIAK